jgi:cytochrome b
MPEHDSTTQPVWDRLVRLIHWTLIVAIVVAWLTRHGGGRWHEVAGYLAVTLVVVRIAWGWLGSRYARFSQFVRSPTATLRYAQAVAQHREPRYLGHNPLGAWMIVALIVTIIAVCFTGWLYTTDTYWGVEWVERWHDFLADALLVLVSLHVAGVIFSSTRHRENLVAAMFTGRKAKAGPSDVA